MAIFNSYVKLPEGIIVIIHELGNSWCADSADSTEKPRRSWGFSTSSRLFWTSECKRKSKCGQLEFPLRTIPVISWWWETTPERQTCPCTFLSRETSWNVLKHLETSWHILIHLETFWDFLRHLETSWDILRHLETSWSQQNETWRTSPGWWRQEPSILWWTSVVVIWAGLICCCLVVAMWHGSIGGMPERPRKPENVVLSLFLVTIWAMVNTHG